MALHKQLVGFKNKRTAETLARKAIDPPILPQQAYIANAVGSSVFGNPAAPLTKRLRTYIVRASSTITAAAYNGDVPARLVAGTGTAWIMERSKLAGDIATRPLSYFTAGANLTKLEVEVFNLRQTSYQANTHFVVVQDMDGDFWIVEDESDPSSPPGTIDPRNGYAFLTADLCGTATGTVTGGKYWDGTNIAPAPGTVNNKFLSRGRSGDVVLLGLIDWGLGAGDEWTITKVLLQQRALLYHFEYRHIEGIDQEPDTCGIHALYKEVSVESCDDAEYTYEDYEPIISLYQHEIPVTFDTPSRQTEDTVRDTAQDDCKIVAKTKQFCLFEQTPDDGADEPVATFSPTTVLKKIYVGTKCVDNVVVPVYRGDIQTIYVLCSDTPIVEEQIEGEPCEGEEESC